MPKTNKKSKRRGIILYIIIFLVAITIGGFILGSLNYFFEDYILIGALPFDIRWFLWTLILFGGFIIAAYMGINAYSKYVDKK